MESLLELFCDVAIFAKHFYLSGTANCLPVDKSNGSELVP
jgi:hypothetical protein